MLDEKTIVVIDDNDNEIEMEILFTFNDDTFNRDYVLYVDPKDDSGEVFVSVYTEEGELLEITDENEWAMIEEVFEAFVIQHSDEDEIEA